MYKKFIAAMAWNSVNTILYKAILLLHQIVLFYFISKELYGISGTLFAMLYLLIGCTNFGFEYNLFTFFSYYTKSKQSFSFLIYQFCFKTLSTLSVVICIWALLHSRMQSQITTFFHYQISPITIFYVLIIFFIESIRKYIETIAQLAFLNKQITIIQITMITWYVGIVWLSYYQYGIITLNTIFSPLIITSCIEIAWLITLLYSFYKTLPPTTLKLIPPIPTKVILKEQVYSYINQISKNIFSPNFLIIIIASHVTMQQTGIIRFYTNIITLLYMLLNKSIAIPSGALLSSITQDSFKKTKQIFLTITNNYIQLLYTLAIVIIMTISHHMIMHQCESQTIYICLLFIAVGFIEYITITYEKLYIIQQKTDQLALINFISAITALTFLYKTPIILFLAIMCIIRLITTYAIGLQAYKQWNIRPRITISFQACIIGVIITSIINGIIKLQCQAL